MANREGQKHQKSDSKLPRAELLMVHGNSSLALKNLSCKLLRIFRKRTKIIKALS